MLSLTRKSKGDAVVGLEIEADSIGVAEVRAGEPGIAASAVTPLPAGAFGNGEILDADAVVSALRGLFAQRRLSKRVRLGVANQRVVMRRMSVPAIENQEYFDNAVRFQAQEHLPMPLEGAVLDYQVVGGTSTDDGASVEVVVSAARREMIDQTLESIRGAGLDPVGIDLSSFAMIRALAPSRAEGADSTFVYCNLGDALNVAIAKGRACLFTRLSAAGLGDAIRAISERTGATQENARLWLAHVGLSAPLDAIDGDPSMVATTRSALEDSVSALADELRLSIDYFGAQEQTEPVTGVVLGGPGAAVPGLTESLHSSLGLPVKAGVPEALGAFDSISAARLTLPYGLALEE